MIVTVGIVVLALVVLVAFLCIMPGEMSPGEAFFCAMFVTFLVFGTALLVLYREGRG